MLRPSFKTGAAAAVWLSFSVAGAGAVAGAALARPRRPWSCRVPGPVPAPSRHLFRRAVDQKHVVHRLALRLAAHDDGGRGETEVAQLAAHPGLGVGGGPRGGGGHQIRVVRGVPIRGELMRPGLDLGRGQDVALVFGADEFHDVAAGADGVVGDAAIDLGEAVAVLIGRRGKPGEPGRELDLEPDFHRPALARIVQEGLGRTLAHELRSTAQAPAFGAHATHDVFQAVAARDLLRYQKLDQRRQRQRMGTLLGGKRGARHGSGQRARHQRAPEWIGHVRSLALLGGRYALGRGIGVHEVGVVGGVVEAGAGGRAHPPHQHLCGRAPVGWIERGDVAAGRRDRGTARRPGKARARAPGA